MPDTPDYIKQVLRNKILEARVELRKERESYEELEKKLATKRRDYLRWRQRIIEIQQYIGDPVNIDPSYQDESVFHLALKKEQEIEDNKPL